MLQPLVVGLGRSGSGLHARTLTRLAGRTADGSGPGDDPLVALPVVGCDPRADLLRPSAAPGITLTGTLDEALQHLDPATTVAHVCTPPALRRAVVAELAGRGVRRMIVEKPLAASRDELE
ncbi:MAG TPA: hypothetical protein VFP69_20865, partial [Streptomyces sp.]|nr:hypothetical protein [Streptomyces sp.]